jgi:hypothetical protein
VSFVMPQFLALGRFANHGLVPFPIFFRSCVYCMDDDRVDDLAFLYLEFIIVITGRCAFGLLIHRLTPLNRKPRYMDRNHKLFTLT